jgi:cytochrome d ubiquinol oxidase subunit II
VGLVLIGWFRLQYPVIINSSIEPLTIYTAAAPETTLRYLLYALIGGSLIIFPALFYLLTVFKLSETDELAGNAARH